MYMCMCVCVYVCMCVCVYVCMCVCVYVCMYVCMHVCMYVFMYLDLLGVLLNILLFSKIMPSSKMRYSSSLKSTKN